MSQVGDLQVSMSGGSSWFGHGTAMGPDRAASAATAAINSPLKLGDIGQASSLLVLISAPQDTTTPEVRGTRAQAVLLPSWHCGLAVNPEPVACALYLCLEVETFHLQSAWQSLTCEQMHIHSSSMLTQQAIVRCTTGGWRHLLVCSYALYVCVPLLVVPMLCLCSCMRSPK
jgi:hypothetical protein